MWDRPEALATVTALLVGLAGVATLYAAIFLVVHMPVFAVREVVVTGSISRVTATQVDNVVRRQLRGNFFTINLDASRQAFEKLPWVREVQVRRLWPDRLEVVLDEHVALARWGDQGLVNTRGEIFEAASDARLPVLEGPRELAPDMAGNLVRFRSSLSPIGREVSEIRVSERRAWTVRLQDGMTLELGREQVAKRMATFAAMYASSIATLREPPPVVDLRYPNGFAVRVRPQNNGV
ncbi:MAG: cell division protein FtsQ/DivIB [Betaproteobacteria bacterium]|jgi:cell division protein FtsQ